MFYVFDKVLTRNPVYIGCRKTLTEANKLMWQQSIAISCILKESLLSANPVLAALVVKEN